MKLLAACAALIASVVFLSSCASIPEQMAGTYLPKTPRRISGPVAGSPELPPMGEWINITTDGAMTWNYSSKNPHIQQFVGFISTKGKRPETAELNFMATSPFIGTKLTFSPDCLKLTVHWDQRFDRSPRPCTRSTEFVKKQAAP